MAAALDYFLPAGAERLGLLRIRANDGRVTSVDFVVREESSACPDETTLLVCRQLAEYFDGRRRAFELPLSPRGTDFQRRVWSALVAIPYGETCSYGEVARRLGLAGGQRAVGAANARNPLAIVVPCHRVIGRDGALTGYAGGVERKRWLLAHEAASVSFQLSQTASRAAVQ